MQDGGKQRMVARVDGHVQGVGFRWSTVKWARQLGLTGWVRNLDDGSVEVTAEGSRVDLLALLARLRNGPPSARVIQVRDDWSLASGEFQDFQIT